MSGLFASVTFLVGVVIVERVMAGLVIAIHDLQALTVRVCFGRFGLRLRSEARGYKSCRHGRHLFQGIGNKLARPRIFIFSGGHKPGGLANAGRQTKERPTMKRFFVLCTVLSLATAFVGCEKKAEVKKETTVTTPEGSTTTTDTRKGRNVRRQSACRRREVVADMKRPEKASSTSGGAFSFEEQHPARCEACRVCIALTAPSLQLE